MTAMFIIATAIGRIKANFLLFIVLAPFCLISSA
jgi:hypothetical protein